MPLPKEQVTAGLVSELGAFGDLVGSLSDQELATPTRCEGWTVGDVAGHVIGTMTDIVNGRLEGLGSPEVTARQVEERRGRTGPQLAEELEQSVKMASDLLAAFDEAAWAAPSPGGYEGSLGDGIEALWYDSFVHNEDIRAALGRPATRTEGLKAAVSHVAFELGKRNWGPATLALTGMPEFQVGSGGRRIEGDPYEFVLAATGRSDPAPLGLDATVNIYAE
jgi:uncharacterized protein (TIGR03083 family)